MERIAVSTVLPKDAGRALVDWLAERFRYCDAAAWAAFIDSGALEVNGNPATVNAILATGDRVRFSPESFDEPEVDTEVGTAFEDADFLVLDKPANLPCHPGGRYFRNTLWHLMKKADAHFHIATRLDRETSGLLLVCRSLEASRHVRALQIGGGIDKRYLVAVHGDFPDRLMARGMLVRDKASPIRKKRRFVPDNAPDCSFRAANDSDGGSECGGGESCETHFVLVARDRGFSLVEAKLVTGRNHQIRATLSSLGFPVVGDKMYGLDDGFFIRFIDGRLTDGDRKALILPNQALHSASLFFPGLDGKTISLRSAPRWNFPPEQLPTISSPICSPPIRSPPRESAALAWQSCLERRL